MNEESLEHVLEYFKQLRKATKEEEELAKNLSLILREDKELLEKLAQWAKGLKKQYSFILQGHLEERLRKSLEKLPLSIST